MIETLHRQTADAYAWVNRLIEPVAFDRWDETPDVLKTNLTWQVGHLTLSFNYHTIICQIGLQKDVFEHVPLKEYSQLFVVTPASEIIGKVDPVKLKSQLAYMQERSLQVISGLSDDILEDPLEESRMPHPVAKTKYQALDWNIKHTMWHCGQISTLLRVIGEGHDFGPNFKKP